MTRRTKAILWTAFILLDVALAIAVWSRSESWPWKEPKPWVYDDGPVFPLVPR